MFKIDRRRRRMASRALIIGQVDVPTDRRLYLASITLLSPLQCSSCPPPGFRLGLARMALLTSLLDYHSVVQWLEVISVFCCLPLPSVTTPIAVEISRRRVSRDVSAVSTVLPGR